MVSAWRRLSRLLGGVRRQLVVAAALAALQSALLAPVALIVRDVFDDQIPSGDTGGIVVSGAAITALVLLSGLLALVARRFAVRRTKAATARLRKELLDRLYAMPRSWHDRRDPGLLQAVLVNDTERLDVLTTNLTTSVLPALLVAGALGIVALVLDPLLFGVVALAVPLALLATRVVGGRARERYSTWHERQRGFAAETRVGLRAMTLTKVHGAEEIELRRRGRTVDEVGEAAQELALAQGGHSTLQTSIAAVAGAAVLVAGGILVAEDRRTLGDLLAFYAIAGILLRQLSVALHGLTTTGVAEAALVRLEELRDASAPPVYDGRRPVEVTGGISIEDVHFAYDGGPPVLRGVSLEVQPGEHVALVGPNGSGKSTLASLVLGLYRPSAGRVLVDGVPLEEIDLAALRRRVGVVLQDPVILPGSLRENIAYGAPEASDEAVDRAAAIAAVDAFAARLPAGLDAPAGEEGVLLSGGQRQRIAIARAVLGGPALLVLDEPTTHLDEASMAAVLGSLATLEGGPAVLLVTHDLAAAARADRVVHLRDGRIERIEAGAGTRGLVG